MFNHQIFIVRWASQVMFEAIVTLVRQKGWCLVTFIDRLTLAEIWTTSEKFKSVEDLRIYFCLQIQKKLGKESLKKSGLNGIRVHGLCVAEVIGSTKATLWLCFRNCSGCVQNWIFRVFRNLLSIKRILDACYKGRNRKKTFTPFFSNFLLSLFHR